MSLFFFSIISLIIIGFVSIYSASYVYASEMHGDPAFFVKKQCMALCIGIIGMVCMMCIPISYIKKNSPYIFIASLLCAALPLLPYVGVTLNHAHRWIRVGPLLFQPSALLKNTFIIYLAYFLEKKSYKLTSLSRGILPFLCIVSVPFVILMLQPDFGNAVVLAMTGFVLFFIAEWNSLFLFSIIAISVPLLSTLIYLKPYRVKRILTFLHPWQDPQGSGFQIIQSLIAIGSGGFWGKGLTGSKQKFFYLPMQYTDFIGAIIAEETGFIGMMCIISICVLMLYAGMKIASKQESFFASFTILGFCFIISIQAVINLGVTVGLLPTKGIGLPFISYGSSELVCNLTMLGIIMQLCKKSTYKGIQ
jgi:cell division protein FtsW